MNFDNHNPINISFESTIAKSERDGGQYRGVGFDIYRVLKKEGSKFHLCHSYSTGVEFNGRVVVSCEWLGCWPSLEELIHAILSKAEKDMMPRYAANDLLAVLGYIGEEP